ncbi:MAG TPA: T9SS type A sorting domain-containing protein, partial [Cytophagaceae bacterium]|nr:T9SS type A sorting domain-containing protein [Cytophagaceae bacterium]
IDTSSLLATPFKKNKDTLITNAYWRKVSNNRFMSNVTDSLKWEQGGNTTIDNRYPINPVSYNVAVFDGQTATGTPYYYITGAKTTSIGYADNLTSLPINLSSYSISDSIYLSFYWQHGGIGEPPETTDFLEIQFKDTSGTWNTIQTIYGDSIHMTSFNISLLSIDSGAYFFKDFQFRFRNHGSLAGPFDIWLLDYIYLDKNRSKVDSIFNDKSVGNASTSILKNYCAMPYNQYFANKTAESGLLNFSDNNLGLGIANTQFFNVSCDFATQPANNLFSTGNGATHFPANPSDQVRTFQDSCTPVVTSLTLPSQPFYVNNFLDIEASDTTNILFATNNQFNTQTVFWDYYAYDDGSAEGAVGANQLGTQIANKYTTNILDTLTAVDILFTFSKGPYMVGRQILLSVWDQNFNLIEQQVMSVQYGGFVRTVLNSPLIINAGQDFYVGYQQNFVDLLNIGYDLNYDHSDKIFYNLSGIGASNWNAFNAQPGYTKGSMMIRPVFSKNQTLVLSTTTKKDALDNSVVLYPVPTDNILKINGHVSEISVYDLAGRAIVTKSFEPYQEEKNIGTSTFPNGLYIIEIKINNLVLVKKIIVQHSY